jgi:membrane protein
MADESAGKLKRLQQEAQTLLDDRKAAASEKLQSSRVRQFAHFWVLVVRSFIRNRCPVRASALAYSSLLALIPMLALVLSVTTSILKAQGEKPIREFVDKLVESVTPYVSAESTTATDARQKPAQARAEAAQARQDAADKIKEFIDRTKSGTIGATSAIVLIFVAVAMLARIEATFNDIWGVARGRSWYMRVVLYWAAITLGPIVLISALGLTTTGQLNLSASKLHFLTDLPLVKSLISGFLPALVLSLNFAMVYLLLPNTKVQLSAAAVGGLTAGLLWHFNNKLSVHFVSRITSNNAVYGSLGMVPVFMVGMYLGWLILLFGAQVAYAFQNRQAYLQERLAEGINQRGREFAALRLMTQLAQRFQRGEKPPTLTQLATPCGVPTRLASQLLQTLVQAKLAVEVLDREIGYAPARPLDRISAHDILLALRTGSGQELATRDDEVRQRLRGEFAKIQQAEQDMAQPVTLQKLVEWTPEQAPPRQPQEAS